MKVVREDLYDALASTRSTKAILTYLNDDFHEIFLRNDVFTVDDLFQHTRQDDGPVHFQVDAVQLTESNQVCAHKNAQLLALHLALLSISGQALVLQADPKLVFFDKVGQDEADGVLQAARRTGRVCSYW